MDNKTIERIIQRQIKANERVLKEIGKVIGMIGDLNPSEAYTIAQQLKYGESLQKIVKILSKNSRISEYEIYKMLEKEAKTNLALKEVYYKAKKVDFIPYKDNLPLQALVNEVATSTIQTYRNISRTTALTFLGQNKQRLTKPIQEAYWQIIDDAIMNVSTGKQTFDQVMKDQLETIGNAGIQSIEYESGYHRRIDSALRMNLQEGLSRLANEQQELLGEQFGADGVEISVHEAPAEDHMDVQGHVFTKEEYAKLQDFGEAKDINGRIIDIHNKYGSYRPISTLNCYHYAFSIVIGVTKPRYSQEELDKILENNEKGFDFEGKHYTNYEGEQLMNRLENELRKAKETKLVAEASGNQELIGKMQNRERLLASKYHKLSKVSGLPTRGDKIKAMAIQQPQPSVAVMKNEPMIVVKNKYDDVTDEYLKKENANPIKPEFIEELYILDKKENIIGKYDSGNAIFRKKNKNVDEVNTINRLRDNFGWNIKRLKEVEKPEKVKTPDIKRLMDDKFEYWDIKNIYKATTENSRRNKVQHAFDDAKNQTTRIVIDLNPKDCNLTNEEALSQIHNLLNDNEYKWIKKVILFGKDDLIKVFHTK